MSGEARVRLERRLGYAFRDPGLLAQALTHRSVPGANNERLEFLGDALLNFAVGDALYRQRPEAGEGDLTRLRASLVCTPALAQLAEKLGLGEVITFGTGALGATGARNPSILADTLEAVLGAVYVDGGFEAARDACGTLMRELLAGLPDSAALQVAKARKDAKTRLQELVQARARPLPVYELTATEGPPHEQRFTVCCRLADGGERTEGFGATRRAAEQQAAEHMLARLEEPSHA